MKRLLGLVLLSFLCSQCLEEADCQKQASTLLKVSFLSKETGTAMSVPVTNVLGNSISVYTSSKAVSSLSIPVDPNDTLTALTFEITGQADNHVTVSYSRHAILISPDCGPETLLDNFSIVSTDFDSLTVITPLITTNKASNIDIYQ